MQVFRFDPNSIAFIYNNIIFISHDTTHMDFSSIPLDNFGLKMLHVKNKRIEYKPEHDQDE